MCCCRRKPQADSSQFYTRCLVSSTPVCQAFRFVLFLSAQIQALSCICHDCRISSPLPGLSRNSRLSPLTSYSTTGLPDPTLGTSVGCCPPCMAYLRAQVSPQDLLPKVTLRTNLSMSEGRCSAEKTDLQCDLSGHYSGLTPRISSPRSLLDADAELTSIRGEVEGGRLCVPV